MKTRRQARETNPEFFHHRNEWAFPACLRLAVAEIDGLQFLLRPCKDKLLSEIYLTISTLEICAYMSTISPKALKLGSLEAQGLENTKHVDHVYMLGCNGQRLREIRQ